MTTAADQARRSAAASGGLPLIHIAACTWLLAFAAFLAVYAPLLLRGRGQ
jgi:uncharacterized protein involved in response to NO